MKESQRGFIGIALLIILGLLIIGGGAYYVSSQHKTKLDTSLSPLNTNQNVTIQATSSTTTANVGITSDWKTYTNKQYRFSFKYPADWHKTSSNLSANTQAQYYDGVKIGNIISYDDFSNNFYGFHVIVANNTHCSDRNQWASDGKISSYAVNDIFIANISAKRIDYLECGSGISLTCTSSSRICVPGTPASMIIMASKLGTSSNALDTRNDQTINAVISSFIFLK